MGDVTPAEREALTEAETAWRKVREAGITVPEAWNLGYWAGRAAAVADALAPVRALHVAAREGSWCEECRKFWPCPTARAALDAEGGES